MREEDHPEAAAMRAVFEQAYTLWWKKHQSYGPHNISTFGVRGIFMRMWDKMMRLYRLVWLGAENTVADETIDDTFLDLVNYAAMAILVRRGQWPPSPFSGETKT